MLCVPTASVLTVQVAVLLSPAPVSATAVQAAIALAPSLKLTVPLGVLPSTVAVKVTLLPTVAGLAELANVVVLTVAALLAQASTSASSARGAAAALMVMRMRSVVRSAKVKRRHTLSLVVTAPPGMVSQLLPSQYCTTNSVMPYWLKVRSSVGVIGAAALS